MQKTVVVMQPGYLPWLGFFELMHRSDVFVVYDDVQYDKNGWRNRNRIKTPSGPMWLTVPVNLTKGLATEIREARIDDSQNWRRKHVETLRHNHRKAPFFDQYFPEIQKIISDRSIKFLIDLDMALIVTMNRMLGMEKSILPASGFHSREPDRVQRLIDLVLAADGNHFYEPAGGKTYLDDKAIAKFARNSITFEFQNYQHPTYKQQFGEFIPCLSTLDLLFNEGAESLAILKGGQK